MNPPCLWGPLGGVSCFASCVLDEKFNSSVVPSADSGAPAGGRVGLSWSPGPWCTPSGTSAHCHAKKGLPGPQRAYSAPRSSKTEDMWRNENERPGGLVRAADDGPGRVRDTVIGWSQARAGKAGGMAQAGDWRSRGPQIHTANDQQG